MFMGYDVLAGMIKFVITSIPLLMTGIVSIFLLMFKPSRQLANKWFHLDSNNK